jgi:hypothetical protein
MMMEFEKERDWKVITDKSFDLYFNAALSAL